MCRQNRCMCARHRWRVYHIWFFSKRCIVLLKKYLTYTTYTPTSTYLLHVWGEECLSVSIGIHWADRRPACLFIGHKLSNLLFHFLPPLRPSSPLQAYDWRVGMTGIIFMSHPAGQWRHRKAVARPAHLYVNTKNIHRGALGSRWPCADEVTQCSLAGRYKPRLICKWK